MRGLEGWTTLPISVRAWIVTEARLTSKPSSCDCSAILLRRFIKSCHHRHQGTFTKNSLGEWYKKELFGVPNVVWRCKYTNLRPWTFLISNFEQSSIFFILDINITKLYFFVPIFVISYRSSWMSILSHTI